MVCLIPGNLSLARCLRKNIPVRPLDGYDMMIERGGDPPVKRFRKIKREGDIHDGKEEF